MKLTVTKSKNKTFTFGENDGTYVKRDQDNQGSFDKVIKATLSIYYLKVTSVKKQ